MYRGKLTSVNTFLFTPFPIQYKKSNLLFDLICVGKVFVGN